MPRNGSGSYTLPEAAFLPNTPISSAAVNSDLSDLATAMTGSLARDGQGGMTAVLPLANTGFDYFNDPNTGMRRTAADTQAISCGGVDIVSLTSTGISVAGTLAVSGAFTVGGAALLPIGLGPLPWSGLTAPAKWLLCYGQTLLRADYPDLWTFASAEIAGGNTLFTNGNGSTTFTIMDMRGTLPAGKDDMGGSAANRLTSASMNPNGTTLGARSTAAETRALATTHLPPQTPAGTVSQPTANVAGNAAITPFNGSVSSAVSPGSGIGVYSTGQMGNLVITQPTFTGTAFAGQVSTPFPIVQPTLITNFIIYAGV